MFGYKIVYRFAVRASSCRVRSMAFMALLACAAGVSEAVQPAKTPAPDPLERAADSAMHTKDLALAARWLRLALLEQRIALLEQSEDPADVPEILKTLRERAGRLRVELAARQSELQDTHPEQTLDDAATTPTLKPMTEDNADRK